MQRYAYTKKAIKTCDQAWLQEKKRTDSLKNDKYNLSYHFYFFLLRFILCHIYTWCIKLNFIIGNKTKLSPIYEQWENFLENK